MYGGFPLGSVPAGSGYIMPVTVFTLLGLSLESTSSAFAAATTTVEYDVATTSIEWEVASVTTTYSIAKKPTC